MSNYLNVKFEYDDNFVTTYDELPLWSILGGLFGVETNIEVLLTFEWVGK